MLERMKAELARLRSADQFRDLTVSNGIHLGSNDYLGFSTHPRLKNAIALALEGDARCASTGSRLLSGNDSAWEQLEAEFAQFMGAEAALYFSSGYAANTGLLSSILRDGDTVFSDASNDAAPLLFNTLDAALRAFGVVTDPQKRINVQAEQNRSHLSVTETQVRMEAPIRAIATRFKLSAQEAAQSCSIAAGSLIRSTAEVLDPNIGFAVATYGFIEGLKTMPAPLAVSHVQRKPWYSFWK